MPRIGTSIKCGGGVGAFRILLHHPRRLFHKADQFALDTLELGLQRLVGRRVPGWVLLIDRKQIGDARRRQRVGARIFIVLRDGEAKLLTLQLAKEGNTALARNPGLRQEHGAGLIGAAFLIAGEGEELALRRCGAQSQNRHAGFARTCSHCQRRPHQRQQRNLAGRPGTFAKAHIVASRDMAQLVRDHALQLVHIVRRRDQAGMDEHILPASHKSVDGRITHQHELHAARIKPRRIDQRP